MVMASDSTDGSGDDHPWVEDAQDLRATESPVLSDCLPPENRTEEVLTTLWQKGILRAKWDSDAGETTWQLSEMATTMFDEAGPDSVEGYIRATEPTGDLPPGVRVHE
jgi:hypothetical protein